jgi:vacuole morphology and inheritance protein 14
VEGSELAVDLEPLVTLLPQQLLSPHLTSRLSALRWAAMLLGKAPAQILRHLDRLFPALLRTLHDADEAVVRLDLEVIARFALGPDGAPDAAQLEMVLVNVLTLFASDIKFLEARGSLILRLLCTFLDAVTVFEAAARLLLQTLDHEFTVVMVQTLNLILLTSPELHPLRAVLKGAARDEAAAQSAAPETAAMQTFCLLFQTWCVSPVSALAVCLLAQQYRLAWSILEHVPQLDVTIGLLLQLDKLVQLIESPVMLHVRLHLLQPRQRPYLVRVLYGLLALLPQSTAFITLNTRLTSCAPLAQLLPEEPAADKDTKDKKDKKEKKDRTKDDADDGAVFTRCLRVYEEAQAALTERRQQLAKMTMLTQAADTQ